MQPTSTYRLTPYELGPRAVLPSEVDDIIDWGLRNSNIPAIWQDTEGQDILIGVCDSGRPTHTDLINRVVVAKNCTGDGTDVDTLGHSTHVCGILSAERNGQGTVGVAPQAKLCVAKVISNDGTGTEEGTAKGIEFCRKQSCDIISLSLSGAYSRAIDTEIAAAVKAGILVICAAGNSGAQTSGNSVTWPAKSPRVLAIGSYNADGNISKFSSHGPEVVFAFPGENILSCWLHNTYRRSSGTSMAAPFCSGLLALLLSYNRKNNLPRIETRDEAEAALRSHAVDAGSLGRDNFWGWGFVVIKELGV